MKWLLLVTLILCHYHLQASRTKTSRLKELGYGAGLTANGQLTVSVEEAKEMVSVRVVLVHKTE